MDMDNIVILSIFYTLYMYIMPVLNVLARDKLSS